MEVWSDRLSVSLDVTVLSGSSVLAREGSSVLSTGVERGSEDDSFVVLVILDDDICSELSVRLVAALLSLARPEGVVSMGERLPPGLSGLDSGRTGAASVDDNFCVVAGSDGLAEDPVTLLAGNVPTLLCLALAKEESRLVISGCPVLLRCELVTDGVEVTIDDNG